MSRADDMAAIALATLMGCEFFKTHRESGRVVWFVCDDESTLHPLERGRLRLKRGPDMDGTVEWRWPTKAALAHDYVEWFAKQNPKNNTT